MIRPAPRQDGVSVCRLPDFSGPVSGGGALDYVEVLWRDEESRPRRCRSSRRPLLWIPDARLVPAPAESERQFALAISRHCKTLGPESKFVPATVCGWRMPPSNA